MGSAAATLLTKAQLSKSKKPIDASDLEDSNGRQDREKALAEISFFRQMCRDLSTATTDDPKRDPIRRYPALAVEPPTMKEAHCALKKLLPKRKLDFETLSRLPHPCHSTKICCQVALQLCLDEKKTPDWQRTRSWLVRRPYNDVRFTRVEENPSVWISFETTVAALTNLISIEGKQMSKLGERGHATRALWMWSLAVCSEILERQDGQPSDPRVDQTQDEIWGRAWAFSMLGNMQDVQRKFANEDNLEYYREGGM